MRALLLALAGALLLASGDASAQDTGVAVDRPAAAFNLGPLGARARIVDAPGGGAKALELTELDNGAPLAKARPKPEVGDLIVAVDGKPLTGKRDPLYQLGGAIRARLVARGRDQSVALSLVRGTQRLELAVEVPALGRDWAKLQRAESFDRITRLFSADKGGFETAFNSPASKVAAAAMFGLAAFADGGSPKGEHSAILRGIRGYLLTDAGKTEGRTGASQVNWSLALGTMFLAEYLAQRGKDKSVAKALERFCGALAENQEPNGGWAHGPGGPNSLGYTDLSAVTTLVVAGYGAASKLGVTVNKPALARGLKYLEQTAGADGTIGYSTRSGQLGMQGCGRTSIGLIAFLAAGERKHPLVAKMRTFIGAHLERLPEEHASPMYQIAFGGWGAALIGKQKRFLELYELELLLARKHDGTFYPRPSKENVKTDAMLGEAWPAGAYLLAWSAVSARRLSFVALR